MDENKTTEVVDQGKNKKKTIFDVILETGAKAGEAVWDAGKVAYAAIEETAPVVIKKVGDAAAEVATWVEENVEAQKAAQKKTQREKDLKTLRPIFKDDIPLSFNDYPILNIVVRDEIREKADVCKGSLGFMTSSNGLDVLNVYLAEFDKFSIITNEKPGEGVYFSNPYVPGEYIDSNLYAKYLKEEKERELVKIADSLGAKYVSVSFETIEKKGEEKKVKADAKVTKVKADFEAEKKLSESLELLIKHVTHLKPHNNPVVPKLTYFKEDKTILELIDRRMRNALVSDTYSFEYSRVTHAKMKEAIKVDSAVKALKLGVSQSLAVCYNLESSIRLNYRIEFED